MERRAQEVLGREIADEAPVMPERHGVVDDLEPIREQLGGRKTVGHLEGDHAREVLHLPARRVHAAGERAGRDRSPG